MEAIKRGMVKAEIVNNILATEQDASRLKKPNGPLPKTYDFHGINKFQDKPVVTSMTFKERNKLILYLMCLFADQ